MDDSALNTEQQFDLEQQFDSEQEIYFYYWLNDLKDKGLVIDFIYEPDPFLLCNEAYVKWNKQLKTKTKEHNNKIIHDLKYTIDFEIEWSDKTDGILTYADDGIYTSSPRNLMYRDSNNKSYIEVKPSFNYQNMNRHVKVKIAWVYAKYNKYIQIITPNKLFQETFYPERYKYTLSGKSLRRSKVNGLYENVIDTHIFVNDYLSNNFKELTN